MWLKESYLSDDDDEKERKSSYSVAFEVLTAVGYSAVQSGRSSPTSWRSALLPSS
jgi:hypothetical protein